MGRHASALTNAAERSAGQASRWAVCVIPPAQQAGKNPQAAGEGGFRVEFSLAKHVAGSLGHKEREKERERERAATAPGLCCQMADFQLAQHPQHPQVGGIQRGMGTWGREPLRGRLQQPSVLLPGWESGQGWPTGTRAQTCPSSLAGRPAHRLRRCRGGLGPLPGSQGTSQSSSTGLCQTLRAMAELHRKSPLGCTDGFSRGNLAHVRVIDGLDPSRPFPVALSHSTRRCHAMRAAREVMMQYSSTQPASEHGEHAR